MKNRPYKSLADAAIATGDQRYAGGSVGIWYARGVHLFDHIVKAKPQGRLGVDILQLTRANLGATHCHLGNIEADHPQLAFQLMDAERWSPKNQANALIEALAVGHTSMLAGDVIDFRGELLLVEYNGFSRLQKVYGWGESPAHLKTRAQLAEEGLRPGRAAKPVARIEWKRGEKWADLFATYDAVKKRKATPAQLEAIAARQLKASTCPWCKAVFSHRLPRYWGQDDCPFCSMNAAADGAKEILASNPLYLDFETTDLGGFGVELAILDSDGNVLFDERMNPLVPIEEGAIRVHGIRDADVCALPTFADYHQRIRELLEGRVVVAYNADFDRGVLDRELYRIGAEKIKIRWECAKELLMLYHCSKYPERLGGDHSARGDCLMVRRLVQAIADKNV